MKKIAFVLALTAIAISILPACKKSKAETEPYLTVETTPANKSNNLNILGPDFPLKVEITSVMPPKGVKITVVANVDGSSATPFFTATSSSSTAPQNNYTITGTPDGVTCRVSITVSSLSTATNVWQGYYLYSKK